MLDDRKAALLAALVEIYIETGAPVSSTAVLDRSAVGVSPATVRNDLAVLEREGYAVQPHTSAGRVPTSLAYRYYVDHLGDDVARAASTQQIHQFLSSVHTELSRLLKATSSLLAEVTHYPAVVLGPGLSGEAITGVHLVQVSSRAVLLVLVGSAGQVRQQVLALDEAVETREVEAAETVLVEALEGGVLDVGDFEAPPAVAKLVDRVVTAVERLDEDRDIYVGGTSTLATAWEDVAEVNRVLEVLEREAMLLRVLAGANAGTLIRIGEEHPIGGDVSIVSSSYTLAGTEGRVGVIGPRRMDYRRTISVVEEVSEVLGGLLEP
ncbi:MAG: heat-inducible transcriptional repressor HrcA [Acidimicrobiia bacterium]